MNTDIKTRWIARLLDPEIKQGKGRLCVRDRDGEVSYCCLGVLTELAVEEGVIPPGKFEPVETRGAYGKFYDDEGDSLNQDAILPVAVSEWAGLPGGNPFVGRRTLALLNDQGHTFAEIAEIIEEQL